MRVSITASTADLAKASGDLLVVLLDDEMRLSLYKTNPLYREAESVLKRVQEKLLLEPLISCGHHFDIRFANVLCVPLRLEAHKEPDDQVRSAAAKAMDYARRHNLENISFLLETKAGLRAVPLICEGLLLGAYEFTNYKASKYPRPEMNAVILVHASNLRAARATVKRREIACAAANHARDIVNLPGSELPPEKLAAYAKKLATKYGLAFNLLKAADLKREGYVGVLAVGAGSVNSPVLFTLEYRGARHKQVDVALVGKGVTFDTGGISLKPWDKMWEMKMDMSGASTVIHTMEAIAQLKPKLNVVAVVPSAENRPDARAYLPGDVLKYKNDVTVEVHSTDAEGRLILADGLLHAQDKFAPETIVDVATLTGACVRALGPDFTGIMANDAPLAQNIIRSGARSGEKLWELPLPVEYDEMIVSKIATIKNIGGALAGAQTAGLFLQHFVNEGVKWAHLDIAGTAYYDKERRQFLQPGATGVMVRTLTDWLMEA